jgi:hypothetical protein
MIQIYAKRMVWSNQKKVLGYLRKLTTIKPICYATLALLDAWEKKTPLADARLHYQTIICIRRCHLYTFPSLIVIVVLVDSVVQE